MLKFKKILVASDFSEPANAAIRQGHALARAHGAEFIVCHAIPHLLRANPLFPERNWREAVAFPKLMEKAADALEQRVIELTGRPKEDTLIVIDHGGPDSAVLRQVDEIGADLVVIGSRGHTGLRHVLLGSVAERVIRFAACSALVARPSPSSGHILGATDFSEPSLPALEMASSESTRRGGTLTVMHSLGIAARAVTGPASPLGGGPVVPPEDAVESARSAALDLLAESLTRFGAEGERLVTVGVPEDDILDASASSSTEMIVIGSLGRTGIARIALGGVAETVARRASCSVLVMRYGL